LRDWLYHGLSGVLRCFKSDRQHYLERGHVRSI